MAELGKCYEGRYLQASFNGVAFQALEASSEHGRRGAEGEFPFSNRTGYVDMGRKIRRYSITARLADNDHMTRSAALIAACELPGPGILIHPTRGVLNAACTNLNVRDDVLEEQGVTYLDLEFVEGELWQNGFGLVGSLLGLALRPLLEASSDQFRSRYNVRTEAIYQQPQVRQLGQAAAVQYATEYDRSGRADPRASADLWQVSEDPSLTDDVDVMDDLVRKGSATIARQLTFNRRFEAFRRIANWSAQPVVNTASEALVDHMRVTAGGYMAQAAVQRDYASTDQALTALDQTLQVLGEEADIAYQNCDNNLFLTLREFIADFTRRMYVVAYGRPARVQYDFGGGVSPLQAAYAIWDDATRARELLDSNTEGTYGRIGPGVVALPGV